MKSADPSFLGFPIANPLGITKAVRTVAPPGRVGEASRPAAAGIWTRARGGVDSGKTQGGFQVPLMVEISAQPGDLARAVRFSGGRAARLPLHRGRPVRREAWWEPPCRAFRTGRVGWLHVRFPYRGSRRQAWRRRRQKRVEAQRDHDPRWESGVTDAPCQLPLDRPAGVEWAWER